MEMEEEDSTSVDDNDTMEDAYYEEWVIKELASFNRGAVTNLEVGLVDKHSYESGTWFVNRWIPPPANQTSNH